MDNATTQSKEALLEPVLPGSVTFDENILAPLQNNYLYKESKECFTYKSAHLINNAALQKRYAAFRTDKQEKGYSEQELESSYGFLLFDDVDKAKKVGEKGLLVGQAKCTTLGDSSKGVYISKYSDCLDLKRWYDGKTGYIVLVKLTKGKVKEVTDNYTQNFTPPTPRFDCHVSEQLGAVTSTTSSFLAFERTQYYLYELAGSGKVEPCPRQACPLAIVAFSYGATAANSGLETQSQDKKVFRYKPWIGQLKIESTVYDVGLQSVSGAWFPAKLPKMVKIDRAIGVSELKRTLPWEIFETCLVGEVCIDGRCFNLYDVVSSKAKNDLAQITQELKEKDMALVIPLDDSGFLILLHSSHLFSYEDARSGKAAVLQGMFIFPDSRAVPRDTKCSLPKHTVSADIIQAIPAINYAEAEMEKCPPNQRGAPHTTLEKHLQNYATLIQPGLLDAPTREASMFPDQYDVPSGFTLISPKWSQETGTRLKSYFKEPCGFTVPVIRALELLAAGRQQRSDEHDDDVYYISSPEEVPPAPAEGAMEVTEQAEASSDGQSTIPFMALENNDKDKHLSAEQSQPALQEGLGTMGTAVVTVANSVPEYPTSTVSPKLGDVPTENCVTVGVDAKKSTKETLVKTSSTQSVKEGTAVGGGLEDNIHPEKTMADNKVDWRSRPKRRGRNRKMHWKALQVKKEVRKELTLPTSSLPHILPVNSTEAMMDKKEQPKSDSLTTNDINQRPHSSSRGRGHRRRGVSRNLSETRKEQAPFESTVVSTSMPTETLHDQDEKIDSGTDRKRDWRSLPRRKRLWNTDANLKRCLRSDAIKTDNDDSISEESLTRGPKRKIERFSQKDRYGLKNIITTCGRVFVPHGSDVASGDVDSSNVCVETSIDTEAEVISSMENKSTKIVESSEVSPSKVQVVNAGQVSSESPLKDKPRVQIVTPIAVVSKQNKSSPAEMDKSQQPTTSASNEAESLQHNMKDHFITAQADKTTSPPRVPDQSTSTLPKVASPEKAKKKEKRPVYSAISISKLKTVLRRGKRSKFLSSGGDGKSESEPKKGKSENIMDNISNKQLKDKGLQSVSDEEQHSLLSHGSQEPMTTLPVTWKGLIPKASKENGPPNFHTSVPCKIVKQADEQLMSSLIGEGVGRISSDAKGCTEKLTAGATLPSDALSLLADLALGASNSKTLSDLEAKHGQEMPAGVKAGANPESVLHALLQCPSTRLKLPPRSPFPEGLIVTGELHLEISKEHSYSQPTSLLSGLSGTCPQVYSPPVESPLALKSGLHLNLPMNAAMPFCQKGVKTEWKSLIPPNGPLQSNSKTKMRRSKIFQNRRIVEKKESIEVVRIWRETYEFKYDSRFTNDSLDKTVMRALHGKWNFDIEDTPKEVHLIFHMWIALFYSKSTSRLFHLENSTALSKGKDNMDVKDKQDVDPMKTPMASLNVKLNLKEDLPKALHLPSEILDLSVKNCEPVNLHLSLQQSRGDDTVSHTQVASHEMEPNHSSSGPSISKVTALMDHRSAMDILVGNVASDKDDDIDDENDIIADCSYTQLLEGNSAYGWLCEQASNMKISMQPQMQVQKSANIYKNVAPMRTTSLTFKDIGVFHQVIKQSAFSKCSGLVSYRKSFDQCLMAKNVVYVQQKKKEDMSKNSEGSASFKACETQDGPVSVGDENVDKTSAFSNADGLPALVLKESESETKSSTEVSQTDEDSQDGGLTIVEDETLEENVTSKSLSGDALSVAEHNTPNADLHDHTDKCDSHADELKDKLLPETRVEEQNETMNAKEDLEDDSNVVNASPRSVEETVGERDERCSVQEKIEDGQSKSDERTKRDGIDSECEISTAVVEPDELAVDLIDNTDNVDMEISDDDSEDNPAIDAYELNTPSVNSFVSETINSDVKTDQSETQTEHPVEANPGDDVCEEHDVSYSGDGTSLSCQLMSVEEKTASASNSDTVEVTQSEKENVTLEQNIEVQEEALELCENESKPTHNTESSKLEVSQEDKERDVDDVDETFNGNDDESQTSYSCEDKAQDTHQKCQSPKMSGSSPNSTTNSCEETVASQALSDSEINSTCSTPTQDEVSYDPEISDNGSEVSDFSKGSNRNLHSNDNTDHEVSPHSQVHTKISFSSEELGWRKSKYTPTMSPREKQDIQFNNLCPTSQQKDEQITISESTSQHNSDLSYRDYDVDETRRSYDPSDEHLPWFYCKTDRSGHHFDEDYPFDEDYSDVNYPVYNPEVSENSYEPKMMGNFCWTKKNYKSESLSASDDANRRGDSFRCQTKVTYDPQYATDNLEMEQIPDKRSRTDRFTDVENAEWNEEDSLSCTVDYSVRKTYHTTKPTRTVTVNSLSQGRKSKQRFDWRRYFRREATWDDSDSEGSKKFDIPPSSLVSVLDKKGNRVTFDKSPALKPLVDLNRMTIRPEDSSNHWQDGQNKVDLIQSAVDLEYLIFSEQLNCILKESRSSLRHRSDTEHGMFPMTARFVESSNDVESPSLTELKIKVDLSDRKGIKRKRRHFCDTGSETTEHESRMNDVWTDRTVPGQTEAIKSKWDQDSRQPGFSGSVRKDALDNLHGNLSFTVKQECNVKYRFYILVTSADNFFNETRNLLMIKGHIPVESDEFDLSHPLLIVLRNEDIAEHISEVPYLLELKKSSNVLFAGIDRPNDVVNFTHQELFANGGFIVCDELALDTLTLDNMKKVVGILEELDKKGKWKWFLHYKDSRKLRESVRSSQEARKKQRFIDCCQEAGIVEILPFHDCDVTSQGQPDYLFCLTHLQIQNASVRFPVFITDTSSDAYEKNGILTMDINTFSRILSKDSCYVS